MPNVILSVRNVGVRYRGALDPAVSSVDLEVLVGGAIGIVGESGSGKTTLGLVMVGARTPTYGRVEVEGTPWAAIGRKHPLRGAVQMIFQDPYASLNPILTAHQAVAEVCRVRKHMSRAKASARATEILREVGLSGEVTHRRAGGLSGGQAQRVGIARALACDPALIVADEPTSALDLSVQAQILNLLVDLRERRGLALVLISHDLSVVDYVTTDAIVLYHGEVVERGPTHELLTNPKHAYTRLLVDSIPGGGWTGTGHAVHDN
jgi:peptide/nickel transport system ATP-binding protein